MLEPKYQILAALLERRLFRVPNYQRPYSWETKQRTDLFQDIEQLQNYQEDGRHHYMATVVCLDRKKPESIGASEFATLEIVDGQQRITTLIILLKAIAKKLPKNQKKLRIEMEELLVKPDKRLILLQINHDSNAIFTDYLKKGRVPDPNKLRTQAEWNLYNAFTECEDFVEAWISKTKDKDLVQLVKLLRYRLGFVFYSLEEEGVVYTIFNALNSRGLDVDWLDKCKSMLMGIVFEKFKKEASSEHLNNLHGVWTKIYELLGIKTIPGQEILRFAATLKQEKNPSKTLSAQDAYDFFQKYCSTEYKKVLEICEWLRDIALHLNELYLNPRLSAVTDIAHARLLAIVIMQAEIKSEDRKLLLEQWEKMTFKIFGLQQKDARTGVGSYIRLARAIYKKELKTKDEILSAMDEISALYPIDDAIKEISNTDCYNGWENDLRYFLYRYEEYLCDEEKRKISKEIWMQIWAKAAHTSIEHIHPQEVNDIWKGILKGKNAVLNNVHRLGNLVLLPPYENSKIGRQSFNEKKKMYRKSGLLMHDEICNKKDWDKSAIEQREKSLLDWARKEWA